MHQYQNQPPFMRNYFVTPGQYDVNLRMSVNVETCYGYAYDVPMIGVPQQPAAMAFGQGNGFGSTYSFPNTGQNGTTVYPMTPHQQSVYSEGIPSPRGIGNNAWGYAPPLQMYSSNMDYSSNGSINYVRFSDRQQTPVSFASDSSGTESTFDPIANKHESYPATSTPIKDKRFTVQRRNCTMI